MKDLKVTNGAKVMVVGSTMNDVLQVTNTPSAKELQEEEKAATSKEPLSLQKVGVLVSSVICVCKLIYLQFELFKYNSSLKRTILSCKSKPYTVV